MKKVRFTIFVLTLLSLVFVASCDNSPLQNDSQNQNSSNTASETFSSEEISLESISEFSGEETVSLPFLPLD